MEEKPRKVPKFEAGDVLFCTFYNVKVVLVDRYDKEESFLPITWNCHILGEPLRAYLVFEKDLVEP